MRRSKGFTLIELMVVVIILGILIAVVAPRVPGLIAKAREGATKGALATLRSSLNIYYSDNEGNFPNVPAGTTFDLALVPKYIKSIPLCNTLKHPATNVINVTDADAFPGADDGAWRYLTPNGWNIILSGDRGSIRIECTCTDTGGKVWNTY